jgi:hypothetical protein
MVSWESDESEDKALPCARHLRSSLTELMWLKKLKTYIGQTV